MDNEGTDCWLLVIDTMGSCSWLMVGWSWIRVGCWCRDAGTIDTIICRVPYSTIRSTYGSTVYLR